MTHLNVEQQAKDLTQIAEHGTTGDLGHVNDQLQQATSQMTAKEYGHLLKSMTSDNVADVAANKHLPNIEFFPSSLDSMVNDSVRLNYPSDSQPMARSAGGGDRHDVDRTPVTSSGDRNDIDRAPVTSIGDRNDVYSLAPGGGGVRDNGFHIGPRSNDGLSDDGFHIGLGSTARFTDNGFNIGTRDLGGAQGETFHLSPGSMGGARGDVYPSTSGSFGDRNDVDRTPVTSSGDRNDVDRTPVTSIGDRMDVYPSDNGDNGRFTNGLDSRPQPSHVIWSDGIDTGRDSGGYGRYRNGLDTRMQPSYVTWSDGTEVENQGNKVELL